MERKYQVGDKVFVASGSKFVPGVVTKLPADFSELYTVRVEFDWVSGQDGMLPRNEPSLEAIQGAPFADEVEVRPTSRPVGTCIA